MPYYFLHIRILKTFVSKHIRFNEKTMQDICICEITHNINKGREKEREIEENSGIDLVIRSLNNFN